MQFIFIEAIVKQNNNGVIVFHL